MRQARLSGGDCLLHTAEPYPVTWQFEVRPIPAAISRTQNAEIVSSEASDPASECNPAPSR